jgi:imidazolonepropionase-like amidohydrolase
MEVAAMTQSPNPRLQRTRALRSPLSRKPLGALVVSQICLGLALLHGALDARAQTALVLEGGTIVSPRTQSTPLTIVIEGDRIAQIGPAGQLTIPDGTRRIDVRGKFIIPGLIDVHNPLAAGTFDAEAEDERNLARLLQWGVTTIFSPGTSMETFAGLKLAAKASEAPYARFFSSGRPFGAPGGWGGDVPRKQAGYTPRTPEEARVAVRELKANGVDAVKLVYDDMSWLTKQPMPLLDLNVMRAIIAEAHAQSRKAYVHAPILRFAKEALRAGADVLAHGIVSDPVDEEFIDLMRRNGAYYTPTHAMYEACADLAAWSRRLQAFDDRGRLPSATFAGLRNPESLARFERFWSNTAYTKAHLPVLRSNLKRLSLAGIPIVMGTDTGVPGVVLGLASQIELLLYVEAGLSTRQALAAASTSAARMIGRENELGAIEPGRQADLLVLESDPSADIANVRRIRLVVKGGKAYDAAVRVTYSGGQGSDGEQH